MFPKACKRKYYGTPVKTEYGNEIALRLVLGCINLVAGRLDVMVTPLFVQNNMHYYKIYVKILVKTDTNNNMGYIIHCKKCGNRQVTNDVDYTCKICNSKAELAGPLWIGNLYNKDFVEGMLVEENNFQVDKSCKKTLEKCLKEIDMPPSYYTLDEIARRKRSAPISLAKIIGKIQQAGYKASITSLNPSAFKTNARIDEILPII